MEKINSLEHLKQLSLYTENNIAEFFILLNGNLRSSKRIVYFSDTNTFDVYNEIDDSYEEDLTEEKLNNETHIILALENGALYKY